MAANVDIDEDAYDFGLLLKRLRQKGVGHKQNWPIWSGFIKI